MTTLNELKTQVDDLRHVVLMADSESMETGQLLRAQTKLMEALRDTQNSMNIVLCRQGQELAEMVLSLNGVHDKMASLGRDVVGIRRDVAGLRTETADLRTETVGIRSETAYIRREVAGLGQRQDRTEQRQDRMDRNIAAIMHHLGVEAAK
jgi:chromosome segregation ATPase